MTNSSAPLPPGLRDLKPLVHILDWPRLAAFTLLGLLLAMGLIWLLRRLWRKKVFSSPPIPPGQRALASLAEAEKYLDQPPEFVIRVTSALRTFFEEAHGLNAPDRTTEEFLAELRGRRGLEETNPALERFLDLADQVKFAKLEPARVQLEELLGMARELVCRPVQTKEDVTA